MPEVFWCSVAGQKYIFNVDFLKHCAKHMMKVAFFSIHRTLYLRKGESN